ncbi:kinase-like domain-containing protein [Zopfochytrium polystomum]|nr:kinase-like domain-containing protein [Zopfochytrium polystomum]
MREVSALRWLRDCKFIVDFHMAEFQDEERLAFIVMDLYEQDLHKFISQNPAISMIEAKHITFQLCIALLVAQSCRIMHRDLKPPNIMVTREEGHDFPIIKVIDFGLSRPVPPWMQPCTPVVQTTLYRAPELFMQQSKTPAGPDGRYVDGSEVKMYSSAIDMWSVGCILAELLRRENPFFADRDAAVMQKIQEIVGPLPEFYFQDPAFEDVYYVRRTQPKGDTLALVVPRVTEDPHCLSLLKGLLNYDPLQRLDPWKAINHPFFDEIRDIEMYRKELAWAVQQRHRLAKLRELTVLRRPKMRRSSSVSAETLSFCKTAS